MKYAMRYLFILCLVLAAWAWSGEIRPLFQGDLVASAEARRGRPATPVSYAGVARRSTVGAGAPGVGVEPANRGGPVNRAGRR